MGKIKPIITNWIESDKGKDILCVIIVILVGFGSFELGRLSKANDLGSLKIVYPDGKSEDLSKAAPVTPTITNASKTAPVIKTASAASSTSTGNFFASNRGSKYYPVTCSAGKTIKQENRVYFATREAAETAGYELSSSCQ